jgi:hypothetical protein
MENNDLGFIKISLYKFQEIYMNEEKKESLNENLEKKANELINNYNCFVSNYDAKSLWEKKKLIAQKKNIRPYNNNSRQRPRVILIDFNDESKCKKEFTSYLNKLTDVNKEVIYVKIKKFILELEEPVLNSLFDVIINFIKMSSNNIYIDVLYLFNDNFIKVNISNYCKSFINNKEWLSEELKIENKILFHNSNYDKYCNYIKIKKNSISIIKALVIILNKDDNKDNDFIIVLLDNIYKDIQFYLQEEQLNNYKHILELLLDELLLLIEYLPDMSIINNLKIGIENNNLDYSTKFKIIKILEKFNLIE